MSSCECNQFHSENLPIDYLLISHVESSYLNARMCRCAGLKYHGYESRV